MEINSPTQKKFNALSDNRNKLGTLSSGWMRLWRKSEKANFEFLMNYDSIKYARFS